MPFGLREEGPSKSEAEDLVPAVLGRRPDPKVFVEGNLRMSCSSLQCFQYEKLQSQLGKKMPCTRIRHVFLDLLENSHDCSFAGSSEGIWL